LASGGDECQNYCGLTDDSVYKDAVFYAGYKVEIDHVQLAVQ
jgi:hypothetical protein